MVFHLTAKKPFSFEYTMRRIKRYENILYQELDGTCYRVYTLGKRKIVVGTRESKEDQLEVEINGSISNQEKEELIRQLKHSYQLDLDLTPIQRRWEQDSPLYSLVKEREGMRILLDPTLFECLIKTIISQQIHIKVAQTMLTRFLEKIGEKITFRGTTLFAFPSAEKVAQYDYEDLQALSFSRRKAEYILDLSRAIAEGKLDLEKLGELDDVALIKRLTQERGIGRWTAECLLLFGYGRGSMLPAADIGLRNAIQERYYLDHQPTEKEVRELASQWSPYESYLTFLFWDSLS
ncbi:DNA-3-methyladenine glycosylase 2 [Risungbinella massiliensis]|uniref:DNA-3-methyladenine glycosylase 2 n=1 Tax=Risungbinella massiliensis TaxID=1329796 RepID=UPI00069A181C|nr:DNA-3-methyladenine glycosylase [Risungbinella massiliensis]